MKTQTLLAALTSFLAALLLACGPEAAANLEPATLNGLGWDFVAATDGYGAP